MVMECVFILSLLQGPNLQVSGHGMAHQLVEEVSLGPEKTLV